MPSDPPPTRTVDVQDDYFGTLVADPYRWLEAGADDPEVRAWIRSQNAATEAWMAARPGRAAITERLRANWDVPRDDAPFRRGESLFQFRNTGLQNQSVLYVKRDGEPEARVLLDPNALATDGTVALFGYAPAPDGERFAYALTDGGSDWRTWHVRDVVSGQDLADVLPNSKFMDAAWLPDGSGFAYQAYPDPTEGEALRAANLAPRVMLHRIGTPRSADTLLHERPDEPDLLFSFRLADDASCWFINESRGTEPRARLLAMPLDGGAARDLVPPFEADYHVIGNDGDAVYVRTDHGRARHAERGHVVRVRIGDMDPANWEVVVPPSEHLLERVALVGDTLVMVHQVDAAHRLSVMRTDGSSRRDIALPGLGSVLELNAERSAADAYLSFGSFLEPPRPYRIDLDAGRLEPLQGSLRTPAPPQPDGKAKPRAFDASAYRVRQVFAPSPDGTRVPMFLIHREGLDPNGDHPTLLYGYGGFDFSLTPSFSPSRLVWLELGGVVAMANLRGGGEYGRGWHEAGTLERKQNVFDDAIACAEYLIDQEQITRPERLAIQGGSNGGLLVGACITQRPDLFGAAHAAVGVLDMLRYHRFTIGWAWASDYGRSDVEEHFPFLRAYSPLHNVRVGARYPALLLTTGDRDDRVVPAHSFKFAAAMQAAQGGDAPVLLRVQTRAGHGHGKPTEAQIREQADVWTFLTGTLGVEVPA